MPFVALKHFTFQFFDIPRLQESQILQNSSKFSSSLHFLQESYKFVHESQTLQICYNVEHFLQDSDNIFAKKCIFWKEILTKNVMC